MGMYILMDQKTKIKSLNLVERTNKNGKKIYLFMLRFMKDIYAICKKIVKKYEHNAHK
jgi:hypothetical protein